jgi:pseudouridine synthase
MLLRLQKILSERGVCSRRKAEEYIKAGLVTVNGKVAGLGDKADTDFDTVEVDGKVLQDRTEMLYYVMNKLVGVETVNIERAGMPEKDLTRQTVKPGTRTVRDMLPTALRGKVFPVGRLDKDSSGLLLFTNDGVLAYRLTHPSFNHEKEYEVETGRPITPMVCRQIEEGFVMDGHQTKPLKCTKVAPNKAQVVLTEGKNRQVRRMFQQAGYTVTALRRVRIMTLSDDTMPAGSIRALTSEEKTRLLQSVQL